MKEVEEKQGTDIVHIPTVMGAVVLTYNVPGVGNRAPADAGRTCGNLPWNDHELERSEDRCHQPGTEAPRYAIIVAHRSDGSGTTNIFTDYLTKVSQEWATKVGKGTSVNWPVGLGGKGNEGCRRASLSSLRVRSGTWKSPTPCRTSSRTRSLKNSAGQYRGTHV